MNLMKRVIVFIFGVFVIGVSVGCGLTTNNTATTNINSDISSEYSTTEYQTSTSTILTDSLTTITNVNVSYTGIELVDVNKVFYQLNDEFDKSSLQLIAYLSDGETETVEAEDIRIRNFDSTTAGEKAVTIIFDKFILTTNVIVLEDFAFAIDMEYYQEAINLRGLDLKIALNNIINQNFIPLLYIDAIEVLENSDKDPNNPDNVILVYPGIYGESVPTGYSSEIEGYCWNREHVWPQSRLGVSVVYGDGDYPSKATDVHNLKPADETENSSRSNDYFDYFDTSDTYEPNDNVKGDIARILFYMATMYFDLTLNDDVFSASSLKTMGILSVLLEWNELDPVDDFERNRNEVIYSYQGNRNPFIDYPGFAELIWGDLA